MRLTFVLIETLVDVITVRSSRTEPALARSIGEKAQTPETVLIGIRRLSAGHWTEAVLKPRLTDSEDDDQCDQAGYQRNNGQPEYDEISPSLERGARFIRSVRIDISSVLPNCTCSGCVFATVPNRPLTRIDVFAPSSEITQDESYRVTVDRCNE